MKSNETSFDQDSNVIDLFEIVGILIKRRILIISITLVAMISVLIFSIITLKLPPKKNPLPNIYKSISTVRIVEQSSSSGNFSSMIESSGLGSLAGLMGVSSNSGMTDTAFTMKLAESNIVIDQIAEEFNLFEVYNLSNSKFPKTELRNRIRRGLDLKAEPDSGTMSISFEDIDKKLATSIVNRVVDILENIHNELDLSSNQSQRALLEIKITEVEAELATLQQKIFNFQNKYNILDAESYTETIGERYISLKTELLEKEAAIDSYISKRRIEDPALISLKEEKNAIENSIKALERGSEEGVPPFQELPIILMEFEELSRNLEVQGVIYSTLREQYELIKLQESGTGPRFQIIEYAEIPEVKSGPSRSKLCITVTLSAFFISILLAFVFEYLINIKNNEEQIKKLKSFL